MKRDLLVLIAILTFLASAFLGCTFFPSIFYDRWVWKHYWGPVVADALDREVDYHGVVAHEGYTIVSEITYGIIALISIYYIYKLFKKLDIEIDWNLCRSLFPFFLFGSVSRVLEDAGYFKIPLSYWFISPLIYVQIAIYALISVLIGWMMEKRNSRSMIIPYGMILILSYALFWLAFDELVTRPLDPIIFIAVVIAVFLPFYLSKNPSTLSTTFSTGLVLSLSSFLSFGYVLSERAFRLDIFLVCISFPTAISVIFYLLGRYIKRVGFFSEKLNLSMLFGHSLDGFTSYISIYDPFGMGIPLYGEKHPISYLFMNISSGVLFPIIKVVLILALIFIFEDISKKDREYSSMMDLIRIAIFILGFSPGMRDLLRVTISV